MVATRTDSATPRSSGGSGGRPVRFVRESVSELRKVLWSSRDELATYSIVVIIFMAILTAFISGLDMVFARAVLTIFG